MLPGCKGGGDLMPRLAPCKGCPNRTCGDRATDCHTTCERYAAFRAAKIAENRARADYNRTHSAMMEGRRRVKETPPSKTIKQHGRG